MFASLGKDIELMFAGLKIRQKIFIGSLGILIISTVLAFVLLVLVFKWSGNSGIPASETLPIIFGVLCTALVLAGFMLWLMAGMISRAVIACSDFAVEINNGNYSAACSIENTDEIGEITDVLNNLAIMLGAEKEKYLRVKHEKQELHAGVRANANELHEAVDGLSKVAIDLTEKSENIVNESNTVSTATEEMSTNIASVSEAAGHSQKNMDSITTVTDEMTSTIGEITNNSEKARAITMEAKSCVNIAFEKIEILGKASEEITSVIDTIVEIAEQTKLLALNATIEAARAGESGKGFAVVAGEVKDLAAQTNEATLDIKGKIEAMSSSTQSTITEIKKINDVTNNMTHIVETIAAAVQEQSVSSSSIASNISGAALHTKEVTSNVVLTSEATSKIVNGMSKVREDIANIRIALAEVNNSSELLAKVGSQLLDSVVK